MAYVKIKPRRGTRTQWEFFNPILAEGELAIENPDTGTGTGSIKMKIGDGVTGYKNLPYAIDLSSYTPGTGGGGTVTNIGLFVDRNNWVLSNGIYTNEMEVMGITTDCYPQFSLVPSNGVSPTNEELLAFNSIDDLVTSLDKITLRARTLPGNSITILVKDDAGTGDNVIANYAELVQKVDNVGERKVAFVGSDLPSSSGWYKVAEQTMSGYGNTNITFMVTSTYGGTFYGLLELQLRNEPTFIDCKALDWLVKRGFSESDFIIVIDNMTWKLYAYRTASQYGRLCFEIISMSNIDSKDLSWNLTFEDNTIKETITPVATKISTNGFDSSETPTALNLGTITTHTVKRKGDIGRYKLEANAGNWSANTNYNLCVLSANYLPSSQVRKEIIVNGVMAVFIIGTNGQVAIYPRSAINGSSIFIDETYTL